MQEDRPRSSDSWGEFVTWNIVDKTNKQTKKSKNIPMQGEEHFKRNFINIPRDKTQYCIIVFAPLQTHEQKEVIPMSGDLWQAGKGIRWWYASRSYNILFKNNTWCEYDKILKCIKYSGRDMSVYFSVKFLCLKLIIFKKEKKVFSHLSVWQKLNIQY